MLTHFHRCLRFAMVVATLSMLASHSHAQANLPPQESSGTLPSASAASPMPPARVQAPPLPPGSGRVVIVPGESPDVLARSARAHGGNPAKRQMPATLPAPVVSTTEK